MNSPLFFSTTDQTFYDVTAAGVVTATASETQAAGCVLPANTFSVAGRNIRIRYQGIQTAVNGTDTLTVKVRFGAASLSGTVIVNGAATTGAVNNVFSGDVLITARAAAGAAVACVADATYSELALIASSAFKKARMASTNFATNAPLVIEVTLQFQSASAGNSAQVDQFSVEFL
ncbi:MAG TPA: hypothetical protein VKR58_05825 [Aquella sp.]|nr:hypothetical protein [Aquella sp.]